MSFFFNHTTHEAPTFVSKNENDMEYREFKPSATLSPYIDCFWTHEGVLPENQTYRCVPSGNTDLIVGATDGEEWLQQGENWERIPRVFFTGMWTAPAVIKSTRRIGWFGIRFKPEIFVQLFRQPLREMENVTIDARAIMGKRVETLIGQIAEKQDIQSRMAAVEAFLGGELSRRLPEDTYFTQAIRLIRTHGGQVSTEALSKEVFVSERQLQRVFREYFGVTPKTYGRLMRFNRAAALLKNARTINWSDISYTCGYADQAHFIRDFREFSGARPSTLVTDPAALIAQPLRAVYH